MKIKTSELIGAALDWAVAKCEKRDMYIDEDGEMCFRDGDFGDYSTDWSRGGPIIEREKIKLLTNVGGTWSAQIRHEGPHPLVTHNVLTGWSRGSGTTPLIAALRCYVASKLGDEVEVPEELD